MKKEESISKVIALITLFAWMVVVSFLLSGCTKPPIEDTNWTVEVETEFCWAFYHINTAEDSMFTVEQYELIELDCTTGDTLHLVLTGKVPIAAQIKRGGVLLQTMHVAPFGRDTLVIVTY